MASASTIAQLKPDPRNARKHNPRNIGMIVNALQQVGAARSIVIDEDDVVLAGNGVIEAAAEAGIERLRVIEADGEEIIAVRRSGLTAEQKQKLALYDNRTAELADWDADVLAGIGEDLDLGELFYDGELAEVLGQAPSDVAWADAFGALPDGERAPFQQMTFTLHDDQVEQVEAALSAAKDAGKFNGSPNENSNGNALARICETYVTDYGQS